MIDNVRRVFRAADCGALKTTCPIAPFFSPFVDTLRILSGVAKSVKLSVARIAYTSDTCKIRGVHVGLWPMTHRMCGRCACSGAQLGKAIGRQLACMLAGHTVQLMS